MDVELHARGLRGILVATSAAIVAKAAERFPGGAIRPDARALPVASGTADAVVFVWSLHHMGDAVIAFDEARRVLRQGGRIVAISGQAEARHDDMEVWFDRLSVLRSDSGIDVESIVAAAPPTRAPGCCEGHDHWVLPPIAA